MRLLVLFADVAVAGAVVVPTSRGAPTVTP